MTIESVTGIDEVALKLEAEPGRIAVLARQTINAAANRGRKDITDAVRKEVVLRSPTLGPLAYARSKVLVTKATGETMQAKVAASPEPILLSRYSPKEQLLAARSGKKVRQGVTVKVSATGPAKYLPFGFLIRVKTRAGGENVLLVTARREKNSVTGRPKVRVRYGPSVDQIFKTYRPQTVADLQHWTLVELNRRIAVDNGTTPPIEGPDA